MLKNLNDNSNGGTAIIHLKKYLLIFALAIFQTTVIFATTDNATEISSNVT